MQSLASLPSAKRSRFFDGLSDEQAAALLYDWESWARPNQLPPQGDWDTWLVLAGRGFGKTRTGAEFVRREVLAGKAEHIAIIGETAADARDVMVEGISGLLPIHPSHERPIYEPSKRRVTWNNGATATLFNAVEPDQLRGPQFDLAWCDELAKWRYARETWDMLQFGLRLGDHPRQVVTSTPRPIPLIREILRSDRTIVTRGSTYENRDNLAEKFFTSIVRSYEGTRLGRQELQAEILDDAPGALWTRANLDDHRISAADLGRKEIEMQRIIVAIDPAASSESEETAESGIVVAGMGSDGRGYVLDDATCRESPRGWARRAIASFDLHNADLIVAEKNNGGEMVEAVIRAERPTIPCKLVHASRGKVTRAEPISALYEQGRISHIGSFPQLEDQMVLFTPYGIEGDTTADRVDALVWAFTELFPGIIQVRTRGEMPQIESDWVT